MGNGRTLSSLGSLYIAYDADFAFLGIESQAAFNDNKWHHVVGTWSAAAGVDIDPSQFRLFVDGVAVATTPRSFCYVGCGGSPISGVGGTSIGNSDRFWQGTIDEVAVYDKALSPARVLAHYVAGVGTEGGNLEPRPDFAAWTQGDLHVHSAGDNELTNNRACKEEQFLKGQTVTNYTDALGLPQVSVTNVKQTEANCAALLVERVARRAALTDAKWIVLTEHGAWLGMRWSWLWPHYDHAKGERQLKAIVTAASKQSGVQLLVGEEMGTAAGVSTWCGDVNNASGHLGVYYTPRMVPNSYTDCDEIGYVKKLKKISVFGFGGPNHPWSGDGGADWHCWTGDQKYDPYPWDPQDVFDTPYGSCNGSIYDYASTATSPVAEAQIRTMEAISDGHTIAPETWDRIADWISGGYAIAFTGGSDAHASARGSGGAEQSHSNDGKLGVYSRTFVGSGSLPGNNALTNDLSHPVRVAMRAGRSISSTGPLFVPRIGAVEPGGEVSLAVSSPNFTVRTDWPTTTTKVLKSGIDDLSSTQAPPTVAISQQPVTIEYRIYPVQMGCASLSITASKCPPRIVTGQGPFSLRLDEIQQAFKLHRVTLPSEPGRYAIVVHTKYLPYGDQNKPGEAVSSPIYVNVGTGPSSARAASVVEPLAAPLVASALSSTLELNVENRVVGAVATSSPGQFTASCVIAGVVTAVGPVSVAPNTVGVLGNVARGSVCTVVQIGAQKTISGMTITQDSTELDPEDTEFSFYFASAARPIAADVIIDSDPFPGTPTGSAVTYNVSCNNGPNETVTSTVGQTAVLGGHFIGDICKVSYQGSGLSGLESAIQTRVLFERYAAIEHSSFSPFTFTFSPIRIVTEQYVTPGKKSGAKVSGGTFAFGPGAYSSAPAVSGTATLAAEVQIEDDGRINGSIKFGLPATATKPKFELESVRLTGFTRQGNTFVLNGVAKAGSVTGYTVSLLAITGNPGSVQISVSDPNGIPVFNSDATGDGVISAFKGAITATFR
jgi:hypothetical protein